MTFCSRSDHSNPFLYHTSSRANVSNCRYSLLLGQIDCRRMLIFAAFAPSLSPAFYLSRFFSFPFDEPEYFSQSIPHSHSPFPFDIFIEGCFVFFFCLQYLDFYHPQFRCKHIFLHACVCVRRCLHAIWTIKCVFPSREVNMWKIDLSTHLAKDWMFHLKNRFWLHFPRHFRSYPRCFRIQYAFEIVA